MQNRKILFILCFALAGLGCKQNPIDRLTNPVPQGAVDPNQTSGIFIVYDDDLKTGGGLGFIPGGENQSINLLDATSPTRTLNQIRYSWNGGNVTDYEHSSAQQHLFAGFILPVTISVDDLVTAQPKDLSGPHYGQLKLAIRGTLSDRTAVKVEGPDSDNNSTTPNPNSWTSRRQGDASGGNFVLTDSWQDLTIPITTSDFSHLKIFFTVTFQFSQPSGTSLPGGGGVIYLDDIRYVP